MPNDFTLSVPPELDGAALGASLKRLLPQLSWSQIKGLIHRRHVEVNQTLALEEGRRVKSGDAIDVYQHPRAAPPGERDVRVVHLDPHLVVIDKPAGIVTQRHPAERDWEYERKAKQPSLEEVVRRLVNDRWLQQSAASPHKPPENRKGPIHPLMRKSPPRRSAVPADARSPRAPARPPKVRAVHRLDRDTSGLMVFALSPDAEQSLVQMFKTHAIERSYLAVVHGRPAGQTIETWLVRDRGDGLRGSSPGAVGAEYAERAVTHVKPVEEVGTFSVIECRLETGRTHQIRIHLTEIGHMLCGERVYTHKLGEPPQTDGGNAPRQALHSAELRFVHPITGNRMQFKSPLPRDLATWLDRLCRQQA